MRTEKSLFNADPPVFELSGNGIHLTAVSANSPMLDMRGDGFAIHTGWGREAGFPSDGRRVGLS